MSTTEPNGAAEPTNEPTPTTGPTQVADTPADATGATTVIDTPAEPVAEPAQPVAEPVNEPAAPVSEPEPLVEPPAPEPAAPYVAPSVDSIPDAAAADEQPIDYGSAQEPEPYVSPSTIAAPTAAAAATAPASQPVVDEAPAASYPNDAYPAAATPIYVQAPTPPVNKGNRGFGILVGLIATAAFAILYSIVALITAGVFTGDGAADAFRDFASRPVFYVPIIAFFGVFALLAAIINRAGWWAWVVGAFFGAVLVYFSYIAASLLTVGAWTLTYDEAIAFLANRWFDPLAIGAAVIAREVPIWFGAWIASRGRKVTERNIAARQEYDRVLAEGPTLSR
ncbi:MULTISPECIES: hypothetical protein [unclassified Leifsonia]|uniref:hypothetical protein n=1 Tax=unclassified Leifsonia TaxID=2663824 RepID=UPI0006F3B6BB|nr:MULTISPECIES: hypothetical protein [unclassified Leifsonia]KQX07953.1 hypothetical protein ASC59_09640 [Leifsonia sp. Root1293]KRA12234.1 hypothetical protein ASD61_09640 [Leifsonia sp. Root60]